MLSLFLLPQVVLAQGRGINPADLEVTKEQMARTRQLLASVDAMMLPAVKAERAVTDAMQGELKAISAIKDPAEKRKVITAYQAKYAKSYELILKKSGVDLTALARKLNEIFPARQFLVQPNFTLLSRLRQTFADPSPPPAGPKVTTSTIRSSDFTNRKELSCGALSGSDVTFTGATITNSTFAAEAGGCRNFGSKTVTITIPSGAISARVDASAELSVESFAVAVLGGSYSFASAVLEATDDAGNRLDEEFVQVSVTALAMWSATAEESLDPARIGKNLAPGKVFKLSATAYTSALAAGVVAGTSATAKVSDLSATKTVEQ